MSNRYTPTKTGTVDTTGVVTSSVVTYDLSSAALVPAIDNAQVYVQFLLLGIDTTTLTDVARFMRACSFTSASGVVAQVDAAPFTLGLDLTSTSLVGSAPVLDFSGTTIRGRATGVAITGGHTIRWSGYLWLFTTEL